MQGPKNIIDHSWKKRRKLYMLFSVNFADQAETHFTLAIVSLDKQYFVYVFLCLYNVYISMVYTELKKTKS